MVLVVRHCAEQNAVAVLDERVVVFTRRAKLTAACLDVIEAESEAIARRPARPVGLLAVIPASAGLSDGATLERQRQLLKHIRIDPQTYFAYVVTGDDIHASVIRATVRVAMLGRRMMNLSEHVDAAAGWLGGRLSIAPSTLKDVVDQLQRSMTSATSSTSQT